jgi:hypothetical protein
VTDLRELRKLEPQFFRAPSAHNTQPWVLEYRTEAVVLGFDPARALPDGDPTGRDLYLSLGALVEAVLITARDAGVAVDFVPEIEPEALRVGRFVVAPTSYETDFTPADLERRQTSRLGYAPGRLNGDDLAAAREELADGAALHELAARDVVDLYAAGDRHLYDSSRVVEELRSWLRLSRGHPRYQQDGLSYECLVLRRPEAAILGVLLRPHVYPLVRALRIQRRFTAATASLLATDGSVLVLSGGARSQAQLLTHGRALLRVWLALARRGLYTHPLSQILDCPDTEQELAARLEAPPGTRPLSVFRAGRSERPARSYRVR